MSSTHTTLAVGLMSGTSADGIDVAFLRTDGQSDTQVLGNQTYPYSTEFRQRLIALASQEISLVEAMHVERELTLAHVAAVRKLAEVLDIEACSIQVVGFHGHTIRHDPEQHMSWQIGDGALMAKELGVPVVYDFRRADLAAGGQGAPLAPLFHAALLEQHDGDHVILNLGGVANVTFRSRDGEILAGDTGPGCGLLDRWVQCHTNCDYDRDGQHALKGIVDESWLQAALDSHPYFQRPLPKSADRFEFDDLDVSHLSLADGAATLCALTVCSVAEAIKSWKVPTACWVTGGGVHHPLLMRMLAERIGNVQPISQLGVSPDALEALCFGWLAVRHLKGMPTSVPSTTGASCEVVGGVLANPAT